MIYKVSFARSLDPTRQTRPRVIFGGRLLHQKDSHEVRDNMEPGDYEHSVQTKNRYDYELEERNNAHCPYMKESERNHGSKTSRALVSRILSNTQPSSSSSTNCCCCTTLGMRKLESTTTPAPHSTGKVRKRTFRETTFAMEQYDSRFYL